MVHVPTTQQQLVSVVKPMPFASVFKSLEKRDVLSHGDFPELE
jgi:hypothetical protein